jgi:hypothetical protein
MNVYNTASLVEHPGQKKRITYSILPGMLKTSKEGVSEKFLLLLFGDNV